MARPTPGSGFGPWDRRSGDVASMTDASQDGGMRTTVTLDKDVEALLRREMRERNISFKQALNDAVRAGLVAAKKPPARKFRLKTYDMGPPLVDLTKANTMAGELEDEEIIKKMRLGK